MANLIGQRPIFLDEVMSSGSGLGRPLKVVGVRFCGGTTASAFTIVDPISSKVLAQGQAAVSTDSDTHFAAPVTWKDFKLSAISGTGAFVLIFTG